MSVTLPQAGRRLKNNGALCVGSPISGLRLLAAIDGLGNQYKISRAVGLLVQRELSRERNDSDFAVASATGDTSNQSATQEDRQ